MWLTALDDGWRILVAGLLLGAGLPILFALGVKSLAWANGDLPGTSRNPIGRVLAIALFSVVLLAIALGISYIVAHGFGYTIGFDGMLPTISKR
ncbi:MAG: hypothetical protein QM582_12045 [Micropruina sp.]|uniref:hypothetical protein n=1 Tax=Micropruina sp. TaxID=2737536 RepID=UPI0039E53CDE